MLLRLENLVVMAFYALEDHMLVAGVDMVDEVVGLALELVVVDMLFRLNDVTLCPRLFRIAVVSFFLPFKSHK